ncbi:hypothetical protein CPB83DRAFT_856156 [Crepidotus variabilis]|uniref:Uncharacterized protein n=1 Tax=Crepidotus variabilis TaxID=179855 RepID=A0A9P6EEG1_9AGAR|nr:hypothetical protein CPB83DRAFT_856156 [Crepidotus variabilis]
MAPKATHIILPLILILIFAARSLADDTGCPPGDDIIYSPFKPWFHFFTGSDQQCWNCASCVFIRADEARKQQFAATALVMGFIPLTLKDIAWPERRLVNISHRLPFIVEVVVRALGLEPHITTADEKTGDPNRVLTERRSAHSSKVIAWGWKQEKAVVITMACMGAISLALSYGALAAVEVFSKRSALGCIYPIFIVTWYVAAILPAIIHVIFANRGPSSKSLSAASSEEEVTESTRQGQDEEDRTNSRGVPTFANKKKHSQDGESAVQGGGEYWIVQFIWAVYYIAGTLIFTSIMAVTVIELVVWFLCTILVTGASKLLGFFLCLAFEFTGERRHVVQG